MTLIGQFADAAQFLVGCLVKERLGLGFQNFIDARVGTFTIALAAG